MQPEQRQQSFILLKQQPTGVYLLTTEAKQILSQVKNVELVLMTGPTRSGKSTRINQLVSYDTSSWNVPGPMIVAGGTESATKDFQTFGPIPLSTLNNNFHIHNLCDTQSDANIFFVDSEGTGNINEQPVRDICMGLIALLPIVCVSVSVYQGILHEDTIMQIVKQFQLNHLVSVLSFNLRMTRGFALMNRDVGYNCQSKNSTFEEIETERVKQDKKYKQIVLQKLARGNIEENKDTVIVLTQPNGSEEKYQELQMNSLRDFVVFLNRIIQQRTAISGETLLGMIEDILPNVQQIRNNEITDNIISDAFDHAVDRILTKAGNQTLQVCNIYCDNIRRMTLNQLIIGGSPTAIEGIVQEIDRIYIESLGAARAELERFKSEICQQKHTEIISTARTLVQAAADVQAVFLHGEIIESIRICAQSVRDEFIATVRAEVAAMNYPQLRSFSAVVRTENNSNANIVRQRCAERLGWIMKKVELNVHEIATNFEHDVVEYVQTGFEQGLNGRILYPHTLAEIQGGNLTVGTNITLYTRNNIQYEAIVIENGEITLPGLSAIRTSAHEEHGGKYWTSSNSPCAVSFLPNISSVQVSANVFRNEWDTKGRFNIFPWPHRLPKYHQVEKAEVSVTIPPDWIIGNIVWGGWHSIKGQTVLFSAMNGFSGEVPLIPISKAK